MKNFFILFLVFVISCSTNTQNNNSTNVANEGNSVIEISKLEAIKSLHPTSQFIIKGDEITWLSDDIPQPTEEEIVAEQERLADEKAKLKAEEERNEITQEGWDSENETWEEYKLRRKESVEATTTTLSSSTNNQKMSCVEFYDEIVNLFDRIIIVVKREKSSTIKFENYEIDTQEVIDNNWEFYDEWLEIKKDLANIDFRLYENSKIIGMDSNFEVYSNINEYIRLMTLQNRSNRNLFLEVAYPKESTLMDSSGNPIDMIDYYFEESIGFGNDALVYLEKIEKFSCEN